MTNIPVYNPLEKRHIAENVMNALLREAIHPLPPEVSFLGAGVYAVYYTGDFPLYAPIAAANRNAGFTRPLYVGKAIPAGGRKGGFENRAHGRALFKRLSEHAHSITQATNLRLADFHCRFLVVDELWIPLAENLMIEHLKPLWNIELDGFGNHDPGGGRYRGKCPDWDVLHPGRAWAARCQPGLNTPETIASRITAYHQQQQ